MQTTCSDGCRPVVWRLSKMFPIPVMVMVSWVHTYVKTNQNYTVEICAGYCTSNITQQNWGEKAFFLYWYELPIHIAPQITPSAIQASQFRKHCKSRQTSERSRVPFQTTVKRVIILLLVEGHAFTLLNMQRLWSAIKWSVIKHGVPVL